MKKNWKASHLLNKHRDLSKLLKQTLDLDNIEEKEVGLACLANFWTLVDTQPAKQKFSFGDLCDTRSISAETDILIRNINSLATDELEKISKDSSVPINIRNTAKSELNEFKS